MAKLNRKQYMWLKTRGGRTLEDVEEDSRGLYVLMANGLGSMVKVYIPKLK